MNPLAEHQLYLRVAMQLASQAVEKGDHPFGALLLGEQGIRLHAENSVITEADVTRHAELNLVSQASRELSPEILAECTLYASTEPCPMCAAAIYWAGIPRIVYGCSSALLARYAGAGFAISLAELFTGSHNPPELIGPLLEDEAGEIHKSFWAAYDQRARE